MKSEFIKRPNTIENYTHEQVVELAKCMNDPIYFMCSYMKVQHPVRGSIPFEMYDYQKDAVKAFLDHDDCIVMLGRQMGKCLFGDTAINIARKPKGFKKLILKLAFPKEYEKTFRA